MTSLRDLLRIALAIAMFLAGVAGARLQGEASVMRAALARAELCLSDDGSAGETPTGARHRHDHCVLCAQPLADAPASLVIANEGTWIARGFSAPDLSGHEDLRPFSTPARGPPLVA